MGSGVEPYDTATLVRVVERAGGVALPQRGGGTRTYQLPCGEMVRCPNVGSAPVPTHVARRVAGLLGKSWPEFREAAGHPVVAKGRSRPVPTRSEPRSCSKSDVLSRITRLRSEIAEVEKSIRPGLRDGAFYKRVDEHLHSASRAITAAVEESQRIGAQ